MALRNIQVGDNINGKKLYYDFSKVDIDLVENERSIIETASGYHIGEEKIDDNVVAISYFQNSLDNGSEWIADFGATQEDAWTYQFLNGVENSYTSKVDVVTAINEDSPFYEYIYINDESIDIYGFDSGKNKEMIGLLLKGLENSNKSSKNEIATLTLDVTSTGILQKAYPDGFTQTNCVVISIMYAPTDSTTFRTLMGETGDDVGIQIALASSQINVTNTILSSGTIKVVLMKIGDE